MASRPLAVSTALLLFLFLLGTSFAVTPSFSLPGVVPMNAIQAKVAALNAGNLSAAAAINNIGIIQNNLTDKVFEVGGQPYIERAVTNNMVQNTFTNCGPFSCDMYVTITPKVDMVLNPNFFGGGATGIGGFLAGLNVSKIFFYSNLTTETDVPTIGALTPNQTLGNGTIIFNPPFQNGTLATFQTTQIENTSWVGLQLSANQSYQFVIRFTRSNPFQSVDIYDTTDGHANTELGNWPGALAYYILNANSSVSSAVSSVIHFFSVNSSGSYWNTTGACQNYVLTNSSNASALPTDTINTVTSCGNASSNLTIAFNGNFSAYTANTTFYLWMMPLSNTNATNPILVYRNANLTSSFFPGEYNASGPALIDHAGYQNDSLNGSFGRLINGTGTPFQYGASFGNTTNYTFYNSSNGPFMTGTGTGGIGAMIVRNGNGVSDGNGNQRFAQLGVAGTGQEFDIDNGPGSSSSAGQGVNGYSCFWGSGWTPIADTATNINTVDCQQNATASNGYSNGSIYNSSGSTNLASLGQFSIGRKNSSQVVGFPNVSAFWVFTYNGTNTNAAYRQLWENFTVNQNQTVTGPFGLNSVNPTLQPSPAYYPTTVQGYDNDSGNTLNVTAINWTLYVNGTNFSSGSLTNGTLGFPPQNVSLFNTSLFTYNSNLTLFVYETYTDGSNKSTNSTNLTISKSPLVVSSINLTPTTAYANATLVCAAVLLDNDTYAPYQPINGSISWLKNGVNQTGLFTSLNFTNGTANSTSYTPPNGFNVSDNWTCQIFANDSLNTSGPTNSSNVTIKDYISNTTMNSTTSEFDLYNYSHFFNFTVVSGDVVTAVNVTFNGGNSSAIFSNVSNQYTANITLQPNFTNTIYNTTISWTVFLTPPTGPNYSETFVSSYNVTVNASGIYGCNVTYPFITPAINYSYYDTQTLAAINATMSVTYSVTSSNGTVKTISYGAIQNLTQEICVVPPTGSFNTVASESVNASGYSSLSIVEPSQLYNSTLIQRPIGLTNTSLGAYYTIQVSNIYGAFIQGASIVASHYLTANNTWAFFQASITDSTGSAPFFMVPANLYNFTISAVGFNTNHFNLTPSTTYLIPVQLTATNSSQNNSAINYDNFWNNTGWSVTPIGTYFNSSQTICFTVNSSGGMSSFGLLIFENQTIVVYNSSSSSPTGGSLCYVANPTGYYEINPSIQPINLSKYNVVPTQIFVTNGDVGLAYVRDTLVGGSFVDGWTWFFIGLCAATGVGIGITKIVQNGLAGAGGACLVLLLFGVLAAPDMVIWGPVTPLEASVVITLLFGAMLWMFGYQG